MSNIEKAKTLIDNAIDCLNKEWLIACRNSLGAAVAALDEKSESQSEIPDNSYRDTFVHNLLLDTKCVIEGYYNDIIDRLEARIKELEK
jgi:hypothetical protein